MPASTVIFDGGWSKSSPKCTYKAMGAVEVICGANTKQNLLHIGVRNKHSYIVVHRQKKRNRPQRT